MSSFLLKMMGIPDGDEEESLPLEQKSREDLIELVKGLTDLTAQQGRRISSLKRQIEHGKSR